MTRPLAAYHRATLPVLRDLLRERPLLEVPGAFDKRLHRALAAPNPRIGARFFWQEDEVGPSAAQVFLTSLVEGETITAIRASWIGLAPQSLRHELLTAKLSSASRLQPLPMWREVLVELQPRACVEFVRFAMADTKAISVLATASALGIKARGRDHARAYHDIYAEVLREGYGRCASLATFIMARGVAGEKVSLVATRQDCVVAGESLKNCLNNPRMPYKDDILNGRKTVVAIGDDWNKGAIAIDTRTQTIVDALGFKNQPLAPEYHIAIRELEQQWRSQQQAIGG
jgi:hypothetical protein